MTAPGARRACAWVIGPGPHAAAAAALLGEAVAALPDSAWVTPPTEAALRDALAATPRLLLACGEFAHAGNAYATLVLADSAGAPRKLNLQLLAPLLGRGTLPLLLAPAAGAAVDTASAVLQARGVPAVVVLAPASAARADALATLLQALLAGGPADGAMAALAAACPGLVARLDGQVAVPAAAPVAGPGDADGDAAARLAALAERAEQALAQLQRHPAPKPEPPAPEPRDEAARRVRQLRKAGRFDVFLCHHSADMAAVKSLGRALVDHGILPWLDEWELPPGQPWQPLLERQIETIGAAAVCVGPGGFGAWHEQEMRGFLNEFARRQLPLITVLLLPPGAADPSLPLFLRNFTWVDFRKAEPDPMAQLVWGITGRRPMSSPGSP